MVMTQTQYIIESGEPQNSILESLKYGDLSIDGRVAEWAMQCIRQYASKKIRELIPEKKNKVTSWLSGRAIARLKNQYIYLALEDACCAASYARSHIGTDGYSKILDDGTIESKSGEEVAFYHGTRCGQVRYLLAEIDDELTSLIKDQMRAGTISSCGDRRRVDLPNQR